MGRTGLFALMISLLLLGGCRGAEDEEIFDSWRREAAAGPLSFHAAVTAVSGEEENRFEADVHHRDGFTELQLTAPELLAGLRICSEKNSTELRYDGAILLLPETEAGDPCGMLPILLEALERGRLSRTWREGETLAVELPLEEEQYLRLYLDRNPLCPVAAEATENGRTVVFCNIENWTLGEQ